MRSFKSHFRFEFHSALKGPLFWVALAALILLMLSVKGFFVADFSINGQEVSSEKRLAFSLAAAYSAVAIISVLYLLGVGLDKFGSGFLRSNDLIMLARAYPRKNFLWTKYLAVCCVGWLFLIVAIFCLWITLYIYSGFNLYRLFLLIPVHALSLALIASMQLFLKSFMPNFATFFILGIGLPVIYSQNLYQIFFAEPRGSESSFLFLYLLPRLGEVHTFGLGLVQDFFQKRSGDAIFQVIAWGLIYLAGTTLIFQRKRL